MVLTISILNDIITYGVFSNDELKCHFSSNRINGTTSNEYSLFLEAMLSKYHISINDISGCCISSVVPSSVPEMVKSVKELFRIKPLIVGHGIKTGVNIRIDNHSQLGSDLVANAAGCLLSFGHSSIIIDFGSATTISVINSKGEFIGVIIAPGVAVGMNALSCSAASLPDISVSSPRSLIGKNTIDSMISGSIYGTACMVDGLIDRIINECNIDNVNLVACGTYSDNIIPYCKNKFIVNKNLTLIGLKQIYNLNQG